MFRLFEGTPQSCLKVIEEKEVGKLVFIDEKT